METRKLYINALLSEAAYADLEGINDDGEYIFALTNAGFSPAQAGEFVDEWAIVAHQPNTWSGLSVTVFENKQSGEKVLAIRGSDTPYDYITNAGIFEGVTPGQTSQYQELKVLVDGWLLDGTLESGFTVSGHSLGRFLAGGLLVDYQEEINHAYIYNAPGVGGLFAELGILTEHVNVSIDLGRISNVVASYGLNATADWGISWGAPIAVAIEGEDGLIWENHKINRLTDSLALFSLLNTLSPDLTLDEMAMILPLGSHIRGGELEGILNTLSNILNFGQAASINDRDSYYQLIQAIYQGIFTDPEAASPILKSEYQDLQIVLVSSLTDSAKLDTAEGYAYRYALKFLNPIAISGDINLYAQHNQNGVLDAEHFSEQYLTDRAAFLQARNQINLNTGLHTQGNGIVYEDVTTGLIANVSGTSDTVDWYVFGSDAGETISGSAVKNGHDRLYGGAGDDTIYGDYMPILSLIKRNEMRWNAQRLVQNIY